MTMRLAFTSAMLLLALTLACQRPARTDLMTDSLRTAAAGVDWELVELDEQPAPTGASGRRATLRFEADTSRAGGFAGCNRFGGAYVARGDSLRFEPLIMTKMACDAGMELEQRFAKALDETRRYELSAGNLTLYGDSGAVARFTRRP